MPIDNMEFTRTEGLERYPVLWQAKILIRLLEIADGQGNFDISDPQTEDRFAIEQAHKLEEYLFDASRAGLIDFETYAEGDDFPDRNGSIKPETYNYLKLVLDQVDGEVKNQNSRIESLLAFNPSKVVEDIDATDGTLRSMSATVKGNPALASLQKPLDGLSEHLHSVKNVATNYDDIYKVIVKPIQDESKKQIRVTQAWAILSMLLPLILSMAISNWNSLDRFIKRGQAAKPPAVQQMTLPPTTGTK